MPADIAGDHRGSVTFEHMQLLRAGQRGGVVYSAFIFKIDSDEFVCWNRKFCQRRRLRVAMYPSGIRRSRYDHPVYL